jgi:N-methylhydantoinase B/oxoprolinase/acetone carboxylase alpha subunit
MVVTPEIDRFTAEVLRSYLVSTVQDMVSTTTRTAYSTCFAEGEDFTCGLFDAQGDLIAQAQGVPVHTGALSEAVAHVIRHAGPIQEGDVFLHNDPFTGGTHLADGMICRPMFVQGELVGFAANRGHWTDIGGMTPGGWSGAAEHAVQEGVRIPGVRLLKAGVVNEAVRGFLLRNVRMSSQLWGDIQAQIASSIIAERRIRELIDRYGLKGFEEGIAAAQSYSLRRFEKGLASLPDGVVESADFIEDDGRGGGPYWIRVKVGKTGSTISVDFTGTDPQVMAPINSTFACTKAGVVGAVLAVVDPEIPLNVGVIRALDINAPLGTIVNPTYPAPTFGASADPAGRVAETVLRAFSRLVRERVPAASYDTGNNVVAAGLDRDGDPYLWYNFESGGCGARPGLDGNSAEHHLMGNSKNESCEVWEARYPVEIVSYRLVPDSGGAGRWRGGLGTERRIRLLADAHLSGLSDRHQAGPIGVDGGGPGRPNGFAIERDGVLRTLQEHFNLASPSKFWSLPLQAGDVFVSAQAGGGGYGDPHRRAPEAIASDVREGYVTVVAAERDYGFVPGARADS